MSQIPASADWFSFRRVDVTRQDARILVVDDDSNSAAAITQYLSSEDSHCRVGYGGLQAVAIGTDWKPHLILMDVSMPYFNGVEAALSLRNNPETEQIVMIAFTALDKAEVKRHMKDHEFDAYCRKGSAPDEIVNFLDWFLVKS